MSVKSGRVEKGQNQKVAETAGILKFGEEKEKSRVRPFCRKKGDLGQLLEGES